MNILYKRFLLCLFIVGICNYVCSCSSNDDVEDTVEIDLNTVQDCDSISVDFRLVNSEGQAVKTFKEGEQILFRLTVTNKTGKKLNCQSPVNIEWICFRYILMEKYWEDRGILLLHIVLHEISFGLNK